MQNRHPSMDAIETMKEIVDDDISDWLQKRLKTIYLEHFWHIKIQMFDSQVRRTVQILRTYIGKESEWQTWNYVVRCQVL